MDFLEEVRDGMKGKYAGMSMQLPRMANFINDLQRRTYYLVGALPKSGKTAFIDKLFVLDPYIHEYSKGRNVKILYFSYEIALIEKMAKFCAHFMFNKYGLTDENGRPYSSSYVLSKGNLKCSDKNYQIIEEIYHNEITGIFGKPNEDGSRSGGMVQFYEEPMNADAIKAEIISFAKGRGEFRKHEYVLTDRDGTKKPAFKYTGYTPNDPDEMVFYIVDHLGKIKVGKEGEKHEIDELSRHSVYIRNILNYSPVLVQQLNRNIDSVERQKFNGMDLGPSRTDFKNTGNPIEDANIVMALFNPFLYPQIAKHPGDNGWDMRNLRDRYKSWHLLESRDTGGGVTIPMFFLGEIGDFHELPKDPNENYLQAQRLYDAVAKNDVKQVVSMLKFRGK